MPCLWSITILRLFAVALASAVFAAGVSAALAAAQPRAMSPAANLDRGPVGWQSYRRLDLLPFVRHGVNTVQVSGYDPTGHNDDGYSGLYSCLHRVAAGCVMAQHVGPGELESVWTAGNQLAQPAASGRLIVQLDGRTRIDQTWPELTDSSPKRLFAFPLALAPNQSWGGSSIQVPMTFTHSMRVISQFNPHYFHVVYRTFATAAGLPTRNRQRLNPADVISELRAAGTRDPKPSWRRARRINRSFSAAPGQSVVLGRIRGGASITALALRVVRYRTGVARTITAAAQDIYRGARLRIRFDGVQTVDAPLGEFFGSGLGPAPVRSLMFAMPGTPTGWAKAWWPMPFATDAVVVLDNASRTAISAGDLSLTWSRDSAWSARLGPGGRYGYFHAQGHRGATQPGHYWTFLRTRGTGTFNGVTMTMLGPTPPLEMEGNERGYVDGARTPQLQGTGTEDFFDGGWYFWDNLFTLPLSGFTAHSTAASGCPSGACKTAYRLMIADAVPFQRSMLYEIQHGASNQIPAVYSSTAYWYERAR